MAYKRINNLREFIRGIKTFVLSYLTLYMKLIVEIVKHHMGQTGKCLKTRINEYRTHINWNTTQHSVITEHGISH